ncbi:hypothetical protein GCM10010517_11030 [Streptosporangium fragile]|uniref:C4-dicarboxylate ABC transporter substrate-binding protein n=1 Tax=Streptosporangium fragile TaxID=46186 RepID=A0ABP6I7P2_9ACTN
MVTMRGSRGAKTCCIAIGLAGALTLAGCAEGEADRAESGSGKGVAYGATIEQYKAAFADVSPITLHTQTPAPKGSATGKNVEDYLNAITEWSDGKIKFDVAYANAVAPPAEIDNALQDGRLDLGQVLPIYEPTDYPANAALIETSFVSDQSVVVGALQSNAWPLEVAAATPAITKEFEDRGMKLLMPLYNSGSNALFCNSKRRDLAALKGAQIAAGGQAQSKEIAALGGSAASVPYTELFESLERGVVSCSVSSLTVGVLGGFIPAAPHVVVDPAAGFALAPGAMAVSKAAWDKLPLAGQQLFYDRLDVFIKGNIQDKIWPNIVEASKQVGKAGGSIDTFADDARAAIQQANAKLLDDLRANKAVGDGNAFVDRVKSASDKWLKTIQNDLGYKNETDYNGFGTWYTPGKVNLDPYVKKVYEEIFLPRRPDA